MFSLCPTLAKQELRCQKKRKNKRRSCSDIATKKRPLRANEDDSMKLASVTIKNYRALDDITITLNKNMNVIYGINGVGKSSIVYILHDFFNALQSRNKQNLPVFYKTRIRNTDKDSSIFVKFDDGSNNKENIHKNIISIVRNKEEKEEIKGDIISKKKKINIKNISFIPGLTTQSITQKVENNQISFGILPLPKFVYTRGIINYQKVKENLFNLEVEENKKRINEYDKKKEMSYRHPALQKFRDVITKISPDFEGITIEGEKENKKLIVKKRGIPFDVEDQLSSGEASVITMLGEICIDAFSEPDTKDIVVLIDEVDTSLHPQWQMKIGKILKDSFPEVQFIMTSHSPFIWAGLNKNEIIWLDYDENNNVIKKEVEYAKGGSVESIITHFFDTDRYDEDVSRLIHDIDEKIRNKDKDAASNAIRSLKENYGKLPVISQLEFKMRMMGL